MDLVFESFSNELKEIVKHIEYIENSKSETTSSSKNFDYVKSSSRRKFDYNSLIISLYGIVEFNTEKFVKEYLETLEKTIFIYSYLNEKMTDHHFNFSIQLINKVLENKHQKYNHLKKEDILLNLNQCLNDEKLFYKINKDAFLINSGNLKHNKICTILNYFDINLDKEIRSFDGFNLQTENLFNKLDDLVQRRNQIAHGDFSETLDNSEIIPFIEFIEKYFTAIYQILKNKLDDNVNNFKKIKFSTPISQSTFISSKILGIIKGKKYKLTIGDEILIEKIDSTIISRKIIDLKTHKNNDVTIELDKNIKRNYKFYIFNKKTHDDYFSKLN